VASKKLDLSVFDKQLKASAVTSVCRLKVELTPEQIELVNAAFATGLYPRAAIERVIREWGYVISEKPLARHRDKECSCYVEA
jgi:hypothetical protein